MNVSACGKTKEEEELEELRKHNDALFELIKQQLDDINQKINQALGAAK
jgi:hypothetical protein